MFIPEQKLVRWHESQSWCTRISYSLLKLITLNWVIIWICHSELQLHDFPHYPRLWSLICFVLLFFFLCSSMFDFFSPLRFQIEVIFFFPCLLFFSHLAQSCQAYPCCGKWHWLITRRQDNHSVTTTESRLDSDSQCIGLDNKLRQYHVIVEWQDDPSTFKSQPCHLPYVDFRQVYPSVNIKNTNSKWMLRIKWVKPWEGCLERTVICTVLVVNCG